MMMLMFTVGNHASFRDEATLSMVSGKLRTQVPRDLDWARHVTKVAAVYGPNASGKSALLDGLRFFKSMIDNSATTLAGRPKLPRTPFLLDGTSRNRPSSYTMDFVADDGVRYEYGFSLTEDAIAEEWLQGYWTSKPTLLFERRGERIDVGRRLKGGKAILEHITGKRELVLSRAWTAKNFQLQDIARSISTGLDFASYADMDRGRRLQDLTSEIVSGNFKIEDLVALLRVADIGINDAEVREQEVPPGFRRFLERLSSPLSEETSEGADGAESADLTSLDIEEAIAALRHALRFFHVGVEGTPYPLDLQAESSGTLTWLGLAVPALERLRHGGLLAVDEIDASLHSQLAQVLVSMFNDPEINPNNAQLLFTTHDTHFIDGDNPERLSPDQVWFTQKRDNGVSELFSLLEYPTRAEQNFARRYLSGRYGAIPRLAPSQIRHLVGEQDALPLEVSTK